MGNKPHDGPSQYAGYGIDRLIRNVQTGRFERSLSTLTAAGALVTAAEIFFEHDRASFGADRRLSKGEFVRRQAAELESRLDIAVKALEQQER